MRWSFVVVGKPRLAFARAGVDEYLARLKRTTTVELICVKAGPNAEAEGAALLSRSEGAHRIILDERGRGLSSVELAAHVGSLPDRAIRHAAVLVGGADGHTEATRNRADLLLSLSPMTLQHELALLLMAEQIYRAHTILAGAPYHRS